MRRRNSTISVIFIISMPFASILIFVAWLWMFCAVLSLFMFTCLRVRTGSRTTSKTEAFIFLLYQSYLGEVKKLSCQETENGKWSLWFFFFFFFATSIIKDFWKTNDSILGMYKVLDVNMRISCLISSDSYQSFIVWLGNKFHLKMNKIKLNLDQEH